MTLRPVEECETPHLLALGSALRSLRGHAGLSQAAVADLTGMNLRSISRIEAGQRRTRRSTLARILAALLNEDPNLGDIDHLLDGLIRRAGPALAAESAYQERIEARRARRERRKERDWLRRMDVEDEAQRLAQIMLNQQISELRRTGRLTR